MINTQTSGLKDKTDSFEVDPILLTDMYGNLPTEFGEDAQDSYREAIDTSRKLLVDPFPTKGVLQ